MFGLTIETGRDLIVSLAAVLASVGAIYRYLCRPLRDAFRRVEKAVKATEAEMKPNGGLTLRDAVNRIEQKVDNHETRLLAVEAALAAVEAKLALVMTRRDVA